MADVPVLVWTTGERAGQRIPVPEGGLSIGRSPDNHVVLDEDGISRFHARLLYENGSLWLQDAGSRNGVFVNESRVTQHRALTVGDEVRVGAVQFLVKLESESQIPSPTPLQALQPDGSVDDTTETADHEPESPPRKRWFWPFS